MFEMLSQAVSGPKPSTNTTPQSQSASVISGLSGNIAPSQSQQPLPRHVAEDAQIAQLTDLYQQQLAELNACHALLLNDQERLAEMLAPHMGPGGTVDPSSVSSIDPRVLIFKEGLDLRLQEFQEDCKRISITEKRLQRKIEQAAAEYEQNFLASSGLADARILKRLKEQQRLIMVQQSELDQIRFEKELLETENNRLKVLCIGGSSNYDWAETNNGQLGVFQNSAHQKIPSAPENWQEKLNLHIASEARIPASQRVLHNSSMKNLNGPFSTFSPNEQQRAASANTQPPKTESPPDASWLGGLFAGEPAPAANSGTRPPTQRRGGSFL